MLWMDQILPSFPLSVQAINGVKLLFRSKFIRNATEKIRTIKSSRQVI